MLHLRLQYPALARGTYFNTCSSGLFSEAVLAYRRQQDEAYQQQGSNFRAGVYAKVREIKTTVAEAFGADADRTALVPSCSHGINLVLDALAAGQKVLHLQDDYPSIVWPFESRGFASATIPNRAYSAEAWIRHIREHEADILAVSAVQYSNGEIIAPATFRAIREAFPDLMILVDGTQFWGTAPFDFRESGIDLFAASAFKWLCAGYGNGAIFLSERLVQRLRPRARGYNTYKTPRMEGEPTPGEWFEPGHQDLLAFGTLQFQVRQHAAIGFGAIQQQIARVKTYARERIAVETPYAVVTSVNPNLESGILSVAAPRELVRRLNERGIVCSYNRGLRLGIHFYNTEEDVDRLVTEMSP